MTQEDKQLLLRDLCARLPYGVKVEAVPYVDPQILCSIDPIRKEFRLDFGEYRNIFATNWVGEEYSIVKPYLRPMSSMTEEEKEELKQEHVKDEKLYAECLTKSANGDDSMRGKVIPHFAADWCNEHHFDYRIDPSTGKTLIESGLAIEAPEGLYKTK